jgi:hypothetical protein
MKNGKKMEKSAQKNNRLITGGLPGKNLLRCNAFPCRGPGTPGPHGKKTDTLAHGGDRFF